MRRKTVKRSAVKYGQTFWWSPDDGIARVAVNVLDNHRSVYHHVYRDEPRLVYRLSEKLVVEVEMEERWGPKDRRVILGGRRGTSIGTSTNEVANNTGRRDGKGSRRRRGDRRG
jgi:hypothetical protein